MDDGLDFNDEVANGQELPNEVSLHDPSLLTNFTAAEVAEATARLKFLRDSINKLVDERRGRKRLNDDKTSQIRANNMRLSAQNSKPKGKSQRHVLARNATIIPPPADYKNNHN